MLISCSACARRDQGVSVPLTTWPWRPWIRFTMTLPVGLGQYAMSDTNDK